MTAKLSNGLGDISCLRVLTGSASWLCILGSALFWAWMDRAMFGESLSGSVLGAAATPCGALLCALAMIAGSIVALAVLAVRFWRDATAGLWHRRAAMVGGAAGALLCVLAVFLELHGMLGAAVGCFAAVGAAMALMLVLWGRLAIAQGARKAAIHTSGAWAVGLAVNGLIECFVPLASALFVAILPVASAACYRALELLQSRPLYAIAVPAPLPSPGRGPLSFRARFGFRPSFFVFVLVFCMVFGLMYGFEVVPFREGDPSAGVADILGPRGLVALVFFGALLTRIGTRIECIFNACLSCIAVGLLAMTLGAYAPDMQSLVRICVPVGYAAFDILVWVTIAQACCSGGVSPLVAVSVAMGAEQIGIALGEVVAVMSGDYSALSGSMLILILSYVLLVAVIGLSRMFSGSLIEEEVSPEEAGGEGPCDGPSPGGGGDIQPAGDGSGVVIPGYIDKFARSCDLTGREREILALFAEGRSVPYIAEKFVLSQNTVKTHMRRIYAKGNVHNRQDLLDILEQLKDEA